MLVNVAADFYQLFGLQQDADITSVKRSYRRLAKEYHPDKNSDDPYAKELFQKINEAYAVLSDPVKRVRYDDFLDEKRYKQQRQKPQAKQSIFDTIMSFGQEDTFEEESNISHTNRANFQSEPDVAYQQPQISASNAQKQKGFRLSSLPVTHYLCLLLIAAVFMFSPSQQARSALVIVWLFYCIHALFSSWWIYRVRHKLPTDKVALGGLILMTHVLSAALSMLFLLPFLLVIYYMS